ncbi:MAG: hypothetical protein ACT4O9_17340 [Blastocatellia bacterium]
MKQCPACKTTYTDDSLRFCLADGATLDAVQDEQATVLRSAERDLLRVDIAKETARTKPSSVVEKSSGNPLLKILLAVLILGFLVILLAGAAGFFFYINSGSNNSNIAVTSPTPTPKQSPTPDAEKQQLKDELANIQKRLDEHKKANVNTQSSPTPNQPPAITATANSPDDGFLALRSQPNTETGTRITKIPHGARLSIGTCGRYITTRKNNFGRWCTASYNGYNGWVFDAFVKY